MLGNIHHCGFVSGSVGFVGGIVGEPNTVKAFMMWQKLILGLRAKSDPDVTPAVCFCSIHTYIYTYVELGVEHVCFRSFRCTAFSLTKGMLSII